VCFSWEFGVLTKEGKTLKTGYSYLKTDGDLIEAGVGPPASFFLGILNKKSKIFVIF
jgi:hypothetical protein